MSRLAVTETLNRAQAVTQLNSARLLRAPPVPLSRAQPFGTSPFYITGVELGSGYQTGKLAGQARVKGQKGSLRFSPAPLSRPSNLRFISILFTCVAERNYSIHTIRSS